MESWGYPSEGRGHFSSEEIDLPMDVLLRSTTALFELDDADFCNSERDGVLSSGEAVENFDFFEMGSPDYFQSSFLNNSSLEASSCDLDCDFSKLLDAADDNISHNSSAGQAESPLENSISFMKSKSLDSSLIDFKLDLLDDFIDVQYSKPPEEGSNVYLACQATQGKKDQTPMVCYLAPSCQVYGCNIDLSPLKDYYKRHKVCDVHSKAAKVVVNGTQQRFCQQCSRFHRLAEFDDRKRSCRRRLAGHNERRRKSEFDNFSGRPRKLIRLYHDSKYPGISLLRKSQCAFGDILQSGFFYPGKDQHWNQSEGHKNPLKESMYIPRKFDLLSRSFLNGNAKRLSSEIDSSGKGNHNTYGSALAIKGNSSCALSLLSLQSHALSNHTAGNSIASTLTSKGISAYPNDLQNSHILCRDSSTEDYIVSDSLSHGFNSTKVDQIGTMMLSDGGHAVDLEVCRNNVHQSNLSNVDISPALGCTVNLLQLSTHLHRVEQQRQFVLGNQGTVTFVASPAFNWGSIQ